MDMALVQNEPAWVLPSWLEATDGSCDDATNASASEWTVFNSNEL